MIILSSVLIILDSGSFPKVQLLFSQECLGPEKQLEAFIVLAEDPGLSSSTHRAAAGKKNNKNYLRPNKVIQQIKVLAAKPDKTLKSCPLTPSPKQNKCKVFIKRISKKHIMCLHLSPVAFNSIIYILL